MSCTNRRAKRAAGAPSTMSWSKLKITLRYSRISIRPWKLLSPYIDLDGEHDIHVVEDDQLVAPVAAGMHALVLFHGLTQAGQCKGGEGEMLSGSGRMLAQDLARPGHVHLHKAVDHVPAPRHPAGVLYQATHAGIGQDVVSGHFLAFVPEIW